MGILYRSAAVLVPLIALSGCIGRSAIAGDFPDTPQTPSDPIEAVAMWSLYAGAICIPIAVICAIFSKPRTAISIGLCGLGLIVSGWVVGYIGSHKGWFLMLFAIGGAIWYVKAHPRIARSLERRTGFDIPGIGGDDEGSGPYQTPEDARRARVQQDIPTAKIRRPISAEPAQAIRHSIKHEDS